ncbi:hypothetical protein Nmel_014747, partial [Mimus melanotis]
ATTTTCHLCAVPPLNCATTTVPPPFCATTTVSPPQCHHHSATTLPSLCAPRHFPGSLVPLLGAPALVSPALPSLRGTHQPFPACSHVVPHPDRGQIASSPGRIEAQTLLRAGDHGGHLPQSRVDVSLPFAASHSVPAREDTAVLAHAGLHGCGLQEPRGELRSLQEPGTTFHRETPSQDQPALVPGGPCCHQGGLVLALQLLHPASPAELHLKVTPSPVCPSCSCSMPPNPHLLPSLLERGALEGLWCWELQILPVGHG